MSADAAFLQISILPPVRTGEIPALPSLMPVHLVPIWLSATIARSLEADTIFALYTWRWRNAECAQRGQSQS
jgi:hypothetical protein